MKSAVAALLAAALLAPPLLAQSDNPPIIQQVVWDATRVATNATSYSRPIDAASRAMLGDMSIQFGVSATTGTVARLYIEASNDGVVWCVPYNFADIATSVSAGTNFYATVPPIAKLIRFVAITTNDGATLTGTVVTQ